MSSGSSYGAPVASTAIQFMGVHTELDLNENDANTISDPCVDTLPSGIRIPAYDPVVVVEAVVLVLASRVRPSLVEMVEAVNNEIPRATRATNQDRVDLKNPLLRSPEKIISRITRL